jgi:hypothetical protein
MKKLLLLLISLFIVTGCFTPQTPEMRVAQSKDKAMTAEFSKNLPKNEDQNQFIAKPDQIILNHYIDKEVGTGSSVDEQIHKYLDYTDSSRDQIAKRYIKVAKKRGNTVKMYNSRVNEFLSRKTPMTAILTYRGVKRYNVDNAFIEFDKSGRIVSLMLRKHVYPRIGSMVSNYRITHILFGKWSRFAQMKLGNDMLNDGYISTM